MSEKTSKNIDEPHTITISYVADSKGKIETYYYGDAKALIEPIKDFSKLRLTKVASIKEVLPESTWKSKIQRFVRYICNRK